MQNMTPYQRILTGFGMVLVLTVLVGFVSMTLEGRAAAVARQANEASRRAILAAQADAELLRWAGRVGRPVASDREERSTALATLQDRLGALRAELSRSSPGEPAARVAPELDARLSSLIHLARRVEEAAKDASKKDADPRQAALADRQEEFRGQVQDLSWQLQTLAGELGAEPSWSQRMEAAARKAKVTTISVTILAVIQGGLLAWMVARSLRPFLRDVSEVRQLQSDVS